MTWLGGWLREIILVVLLASFVEMLLPSKSMERYARLVLSLLVLLTMLNPIVSFLKGDAISELTLAMDNQSLLGGSSGKSGAGTLQQILADGRKLAQGQEKKSLVLAANEIAGQMKEQITAETGKRGVQVTVVLSMQPQKNTGEDAQPVISAVTVKLPESGGAQATNGSDNKAEPILIQPVTRIDVKVDNTSGAGVNSTAGDQENASEADGTEADSVEVGITQEISNLLEQKWDLDAEVIKVLGSVDDAAKS